ncbi:phosphoribosylformylglycinamidine synthase subunit PurQ [Psychrobacter sp. PL15]|uniref:phosphoribosylformylglycinamidine synthase subunit PurQ n=1 Tax=Psychrobacter sp. PL15 TaxID=3071719 RepID=UPI003FA3C539
MPIKVAKTVMAATIKDKNSLNPNGSVGGVTGLCSTDGRVTIMMPHPERTLRAYNHSWKSEEWDEDSAWMRMFHNARAWVR